MLTAGQLVVVALAGLVAGAVNAAAGGGSLLTFPLLVAFGLPALTANVTNTIAQLPGYVAIASGYRPELRGQRARAVPLAFVALLGGVGGVVALKVGGKGTFEVVAPVCVLLASALLAVQPLVARRAARRPAAPDRARPLRVPLLAAVALAGAYVAYFGAGAGVVVLAILSLGLDDTLQRLNALNRLLILVVNVMAAIVLGILGPVDWTVVAVLAPATLVGGHLGVGVARRLDDRVLRGLVVTLGVVAGVVLVLT